MGSYQQINSVKTLWHYVPLSNLGSENLIYRHARFFPWSRKYSLFIKINWEIRMGLLGGGRLQLSFQFYFRAHRDSGIVI